MTVIIVLFSSSSVSGTSRVGSMTTPGPPGTSTTRGGRGSSGSNGLNGRFGFTSVPGGRNSAKFLGDNTVPSPITI